MRIAVFGATGGLGRQVVEQALAAGYEVTASARRPGTLDLANPQLSFVSADVREVEQVRMVLEGSDAVICAFGVKRGAAPGQLYSGGTRTILAAMTAARVHRLLCVSTWLVHDSRRRAGPLVRVFVPMLQSKLYRDRERQEAVVRASALDWTIVRPSRLTDGRRRDRYRVGINLSLHSTSHISRADVADFLLRQLHDDTYIHRAVTITR